MKKLLTGVLIPALLSLAASLAMPLGALAQDTGAATVSGVVSDQGGNPVAGATVVVKSSLRGTTTDNSGRFTLEGISHDDEVTVSFIGYREAKFIPGSRSEVNVTLEEDVIGLEEIVSIGYGTVRREEITSAVSKVKADDFNNGMVTSPLQLLQGKVPGLSISHTSNNPATDNIDIMLRGVSTLSASASPLIVIDGIVGGSLNAIAAEDIESIDILRDGSAAAIYGTQGTNGVIIINTKKPQAGRATLEYNGYAALDLIRNKPSVLSAGDLRGLKADPLFDAANDYGATTDWMDLVTRNPVSHVHNLSLRGGSDQTNYVASMTYRKQEGVIKNTDKEAFTVRVRLNHSMWNDKLKFNMNVANTLVTDHQVPEDVFGQAVLRNPTLPVYNDDGSYREMMNTGVNPVGLVNEARGGNKYNQFMVNGKVAYFPIRELELSASVSYMGDFNIYDFNTSHRSYASTMDGKNGQVYMNGGHGTDKILELQATYNKTFGKHSVNATGGYSYNNYAHQGWNVYAYDFPLDIFGSWNIGSGQSTKEGMSEMGSYKHSNKLIAFFARANYSYDNRYLLSVSLRHEGSSKFGVNNKWGTFPAVSAGWRIINEDFMKGVDFVSDLKLRVGYGVTGTAPTASYLSLVRYQFDPNLAMYIDGKWVSAIVPASNPNPDLKWEKKKEVNVGVDFSLFKNRFWGSVDLYNRKTVDLLYTYNVPVPPNIYETIYANVGSIRNRGVEVSANVNIVNRDDLKWDFNANYSYNANKVLSLSGDKYQRDYLNLGSTGDPIQQYTHRVEQGRPLGDFYAWSVTGLKDNGHAWQVDGAGDGSPGEEHKRVVGNGMPSSFVSFGTNLVYKGLDFGISFRGALGFNILNQYRMERETFSWLATYNLPKSVLKKPFGGDYYNFAAPIYSDYYVEKGDYLKIDNITLGYTFNLHNDYIDKLRVYFTANNVATFTGYKGMDPEIGISGTTPGVDYLRSYPTTTTMLFGVQLNF